MAMRSQGTLLEIHNGASPGTYSEIEYYSLTATGGEATTIDITHMTSTVRQTLLGFPGISTLTASIYFDPDDPVHMTLKDLSASGAERNLRLTFTNVGATTWTCSVQTSVPPLPSLAIDQAVTMDVSFSIAGEPVWVL